MSRIASVIAVQHKCHRLPCRTILQALLLTATILAWFQPAAAQTVILTRHAEKATSPSDNPPLTPAGVQRAKLLGRMFENSGITAIYVTDTLRTQQTSRPLADATHIKPTVLPANDVAGLVKAVRADHKGAIVIVNHSNRLPEIIKELGGPAVTINDNDYDNLFVLTVEGSRSILLKMQYGVRSSKNGQ